MKSLKSIAPDYPRIAHIAGSNMTSDDIVLLCAMEFPVSFYTSEKVDGSGMRVSWNDGPVLGNRTHILKKGYLKDTPAKLQFRSAWNWLHEHEDDIKEVEKLWGSKISIYGEWMFAQHSLNYTKLPDLFLSYDIYSVEDRKFLSPNKVIELLSATSIKYMKQELKEFKSFEEIKNESIRNSEYRDGIVEGIVLKEASADGLFVENTYKFVNSEFKLRQDFNTTALLKNRII